MVEKAMRMKVKPKTCKVVLLCDQKEVSPGDVAIWMTKHAPEWRSMEVARTAKYLGHWMGPDGGTKCWTAPLQSGSCEGGNSKKKGLPPPKQLETTTQKCSQ